MPAGSLAARGADGVDFAALAYTKRRKLLFQTFRGPLGRSARNRSSAPERLEILEESQQGTLSSPRTRVEAAQLGRSDDRSLAQIRTKRCHG